MTDKDEMLLQIGEIKGLIAGFISSQQIQDGRISSLESGQKWLLVKVGGLVAAVEAILLVLKGGIGGH